MAITELPHAPGLGWPAVEGRPGGPGRGAAVGWPARGPSHECPARVLGSVDT